LLGSPEGGLLDQELRSLIRVLSRGFQRDSISAYRQHRH
jgi:hypothetical protein